MCTSVCKTTMNQKSTHTQTVPHQTPHHSSVLMVQWRATGQEFIHRHHTHSFLLFIFCIFMADGQRYYTTIHTDTLVVRFDLKWSPSTFIVYCTVSEMNMSSTAYTIHILNIRRTNATRDRTKDWEHMCTRTISRFRYFYFHFVHFFVLVPLPLLLLSLLRSRVCDFHCVHVCAVCVYTLLQYYIGRTWFQ